MIYEELAGNNKDALTAAIQAANIFCLQNCEIKMQKRDQNDEWSLLFLLHGFEDSFFQLLIKI